jgi:hypothetical protein
MARRRDLPAALVLLLSTLLFLPASLVWRGDAFCGDGILSNGMRWSSEGQRRPSRTLIYRVSPAPLSMAKASKKKTTGGGGLKGFGSVSAPGSSSSSSVGVEVDRSREARAFYEFLERGGAGDNLIRCGLGRFPLGRATLRGVVALRPIKKGETIIRIPYGLATNLGQEGADPTIPALAFLRDYCETLGPTAAGGVGGDDVAKNNVAYYAMLPPYGGDDCSGSTDFFSDRALQELQFPPVVDETLKRRELVEARFRLDVASSASGDFPKWIDGSDVTKEHLLWAVWLITSRVLTVQGDESSQGRSYRLLIPFLDMCNHDRSSPHLLTGRAVPGGELKVVAGASLKEGEAVNICYGGGMAGNDRFIQDYGFLDSGAGGGAAYNMVAQQLMGKRRLVEGVGAGQFMSLADRARAMEELKKTTVEQDAQLLADETDPSLMSAYSFRLGVKRALSNYGAFQ